MTKLDKLLGKSQSSGSTASTQGERKEKLLHPASQREFKSSTENIKSTYFQESDIDIQLDTDLSEYTAKSRRSYLMGDALDFDLTDFENEERPATEGSLLAIDPVKSFSQQIEIDLNKLAESGFITPNNVNTLLSLTFRQLKRPILNNVMGKGATVLDNANVIMSTSSVPGEGKTFCAINMAMSIAMERDRRVLLIDADVNSSSHHQLFGVENREGLTDLLMGNISDISKVMYKTNIPSLSVMFSGKPTPHAPELFSSKAMDKLVKELSSRYEDRVIIFDSAPLLLQTEAPVLASHMGQILLVVEAEKTRHEAVMKSLDMLSNSIVLLLLNKTREKNELGGYGIYGKYEQD